jgi:adenylylsulfate kinase
MKKLKKNKGILFWITGLSGSGKTAIAEKIKHNISNKYGTTLIMSGDDLRKIFNYNKFSRKYRLAYALSYGKFCKNITDNKINIIFSTISLFYKVRKWNKSNINNYIEIYIQSDINKIIKQKRKFFYKGNYKNIIGKNIKAEFPQSPHIIIKNDFNKSINVLAKKLIKKINKIIKL